MVSCSYDDPRPFWRQAMQQSPNSAFVPLVLEGTSRQESLWWIRLEEIETECPRERVWLAFFAETEGCLRHLGHFGEVVRVEC